MQKEKKTAARVRRAAAAALAVAMVLSLFACNKRNGEPQETGGPEKQKLEHVYRAEPLSFANSDDQGWANSNLIDVVNGRAYFTRYIYDYVPPEGGTDIDNPDVGILPFDEDVIDEPVIDEPVYNSPISMTERSEIISIAIDGSESAPTVHLAIRSGRYTEPEDDEKAYRYSYINTTKCLPDGTFAIVRTDTYEDYSDPMQQVYEQKLTVSLYDEGWNETASFDVAETLADDGYDYIGVSGLEQADDGALYINCNEFILAVDKTGRRLFVVKPETDTYMEGIIRFPDGRVAVNVINYGNIESGGGRTQTLKVIDKITRGWGEEIPFAIPGNAWVSAYMTGSGEYLLYGNMNGRGIFGMTPSGEFKEVLNFMNSDIDGYNIGNMISLGDGSFVTTMYSYGEGGQQILKLTPIPDAENKEKIILKVATLYEDYNFKRRAMEFNKGNDEYRLVIEDYSTYNTEGQYEIGISKLRADLITGRIPDILVLNEELDLPMLANKGLLADLYELIDASDSINREDLVQSVLKADEIDGKLYRLIPSFSIGTVAAKRSIVGDTIGWTMDDLNRVLAGMPEGTKSFFMMQRMDALSTGMMLGMTQFIDWGTGTCSFNEGFVSLLEFANEFPDELNWNDWQEEDYRRYETYQRDDLAILSQEYVGSYRNIRDLETRVGEEITYVGFPTYKGSGSVIYPNGQYAISARGEHQQICFEFLLGFVESEPNFENSGGYFWGNGFSLNRNYQDKVKEFEMTPMREREGYQDFDSGVSETQFVGARPVLRLIGGRYALPGSEAQEDPNENYHLTQTEVDAIDALIASTTQIYTAYTMVMNIVREEAENYFAGRKSAEDTAAVVQSRVQIYISESR
ncbi:MAG: hypothetical protein LBH17_05390 [Oscillospiraceae bacterium]|jgi:ABC-type glycerol-3-phosphate transport system substrate-binding protein|nr:hypothetical protein [Oscillospiraceae bacterium]